MLLALSLWIRLKLGESPEYQRMRARVAAARAPLLEALRGENLRRIVLALVCILLAQGAVWYTGHFYAQFFIERVLKVDARLVNVLIMLARGPVLRRAMCSSAGCPIASAASR